MKRKLLGEKRYAYAPNAHNFIHVLLHEVIDIEKLRTAIAMLHKANPVLNSLLERTEHGLELVEIPFIMPEIIEIERMNAKTYKKAMKEEERIPLNLRQSTGYRLVIVSDDEYTDVILMSHQILIDAESSLLLLAAILKAYTSNSVTSFAYGVMKQSQLDLNIVDRNLLKRVITQYKDDPKFFVEEEYRKQYMEYYRTYTSKFTNVLLTRDESKAVIEYCDKYNLDLYAFIFTAFKASEEKYQNNRNNTFKGSVIMRNLRDKDETLGNYDSLGFIKFIYNANKSLIENTLVLMKMIEGTDFTSYYNLNFELSLSAFKALENNTNVSMGLQHFAHRLGYWNQLIGSELSFANALAYDAALPIEHIDVFRASHQLVEKNISIVRYGDRIYIGMQYNSLSTNEKDMNDIIENTRLILTDSIRE
ncbi:MAG: hypothetical protein IKM20_01950 [Erysipelotrichales bacterium]|nr:hypothetical protein [Erysipelotrichales bacterium]